MERAAEAWLKKTKGKRPLLNALPIADLVGLLDSSGKNVTGHDVAALKANLEEALSLVKRGSIELNRVTTDLDGLLAIARRPPQILVELLVPSSWMPIERRSPADIH